jgi:hypothetical protein
VSPWVCAECASGAHEQCSDLVACACSQAPWEERIEAEKLLDRYRRGQAASEKTLRDCLAYHAANGTADDEAEAEAG